MLTRKPNTLYRTVKVETLAQASALPHGTIAHVQHENGDWTVLALSDLKHPRKPRQRFWFGTFSMNAYLDEAVVGGLALVPVDDVADPTAPEVEAAAIVIAQTISYDAAPDLAGYRDLARRALCAARDARRAEG